VHAHFGSEKRLSHFDRLRSDGEILHPYAGRTEGGSWQIFFYQSFTEEWRGTPGMTFGALPASTEIDVRKRADRQ